MDNHDLEGDLIVDDGSRRPTPEEAKKALPKYIPGLPKRVIEILDRVGKFVTGRYNKEN